MNKITVIVACASLIALAGCSANGVAPLGGQTAQSQSHVVGLSAPGWINEGGVLYHAPHYMATARNAAHTKPPAILLNYTNGPVLVSPKMYVIFWGYKTYGDPDKVKPLLVKYGKVAGGSALNNIYTQYYEVSNGSTIYITNPGSSSAARGKTTPTPFRRIRPTRKSRPRRSPAWPISGTIPTARTSSRRRTDETRTDSARPFAPITAPPATTVNSSRTPIFRTCPTPTTAAPTGLRRRRTRAALTKA